MEKKMTFNYFYGTEADQFSFYRINKQCLVKRIESGAATNMKEIAGWCDAHKIPFATKFKYRKDFPLKANIWNLYSYFRFLYTRKIVLEKYYICQF